MGVVLSMITELIAWFSVSYILVRSWLILHSKYPTCHRNGVMWGGGGGVGGKPQWSYKPLFKRPYVDEAIGHTVWRMHAIGGREWWRGSPGKKGLLWCFCRRVSWSVCCLSNWIRMVEIKSIPVMGTFPYRTPTSVHCRDLHEMQCEQCTLLRGTYTLNRYRSQMWVISTCAQ